MAVVVRAQSIWCWEPHGGIEWVLGEHQKVSKRLENTKLTEYA